MVRVTGTSGEMVVLGESTFSNNHACCQGDKARAMILSNSKAQGPPKTYQDDLMDSFKTFAHAFIAKPSANQKMKVMLCAMTSCSSLTGTS